MQPPYCNLLKTKPFIDPKHAGIKFTHISSTKQEKPGTDVPSDHSLHILYSINKHFVIFPKNNEWFCSD
jgi:hypothetical protein